MKIYVGNLRHTMTAYQLEKLFSCHGSVISARIINDHFTRQSKCFGYVEMLHSEEGLRAITTLDGQTINDLALIVKEARSRDEREGHRW